LRRLPFDITMRATIGGAAMKYALLIYQDADFERFWASASEEERAALYAQFGAFAEVAGDRLLGGEELGLSGTATTVRKRGDDVVLSDGPFAEVAEHLGGYMIVEARDLDEALELARALPDGTIEVRPVVEQPVKA
jgi:hypothetical protein